MKKVGILLGIIFLLYIFYFGWNSFNLSKLNTYNSTVSTQKSVTKIAEDIPIQLTKNENDCFEDVSGIEVCSTNKGNIINKEEN